MEKSPKVLEQKKYNKHKPLEVGENVLYISLGEEPIAGVISNMTNWKGEKIYEVTISEQIKKWGSAKQIKRKDNNESL